jgi:hypothetical protein
MLIDSEMNGDKHSQNSICFHFLRECRFDLQLSFPDILNLAYFLRIYYLSFNCGSVLQSGKFCLCLLLDQPPH